MTENEVVGAVPKTRDEYEIKEDYRAVKRAMKIFADKERLKDVQEMIKANKAADKALAAVADGDLSTALGMQ